MGTDLSLSLDRPFHAVGSGRQASTVAAAAARIARSAQVAPIQALVARIVRSAQGAAIQAKDLRNAVHVPREPFLM